MWKLENTQKTAQNYIIHFLSKIYGQKMLTFQFFVRNIWDEVKLLAPSAQVPRLYSGAPEWDV